MVSKGGGSLHIYLVLKGAGGGGGESNKISKMKQDLRPPSPLDT